MGRSVRIRSRSINAEFFDWPEPTGEPSGRRRSNNVLTAVEPAWGLPSLKQMLFWIGVALPLLLGTAFYLYIIYETYVKIFFL